MQLPNKPFAHKARVRSIIALPAVAIDPVSEPGDVAVLSSGDDGAILLWILPAAEIGLAARRLPAAACAPYAHLRGVRCLAWLPSGMLVSGGDDCALSAWRICARGDGGWELQPLGSVLLTAPIAALATRGENDVAAADEASGVGLWRVGRDGKPTSVAACSALVKPSAQQSSAGTAGSSNGGSSSGTGSAANRSSLYDSVPTCATVAPAALVGRHGAVRAHDSIIIGFSDGALASFTLTPAPSADGEAEGDGSWSGRSQRSARAMLQAQNLQMQLAWTAPASVSGHAQRVRVLAAIPAYEGGIPTLPTLLSLDAGGALCVRRAMPPASLLMAKLFAAGVLARRARIRPACRRAARCFALGLMVSLAASMPGKKPRKQAATGSSSGAAGSAAGAGGGASGATSANATAAAATVTRRKKAPAAIAAHPRLPYLRIAPLGDAAGTVFDDAAAAAEALAASLASPQITSPGALRRIASGGFGPGDAAQDAAGIAGPVAAGAGAMPGAPLPLLPAALAPPSGAAIAFDDLIDVMAKAAPLPSAGVGAAGQGSGARSGVATPAASAAPSPAVSRRDSFIDSSMGGISGGGIAGALSAKALLQRLLSSLQLPPPPLPPIQGMKPSQVIAINVACARLGKPPLTGLADALRRGDIEGLGGHEVLAVLSSLPRPLLSKEHAGEMMAWRSTCVDIAMAAQAEFAGVDADGDPLPLPAEMVIPGLNPGDAASTAVSALGVKLSPSERFVLDVSAAVPHFRKRLALLCFPATFRALEEPILAGIADVTAASAEAALSQRLRAFLRHVLLPLAQNCVAPKLPEEREAEASAAAAAAAAAALAVAAGESASPAAASSAAAGTPVAARPPQVPRLSMSGPATPATPASGAASASPAAAAAAAAAAAPTLTGVRISLLTALADTKGSAGVSLLEYVAKKLHTAWPALLDVAAELPRLRNGGAARGPSLAELGAEISALRIALDGKRRELAVLASVLGISRSSGSDADGSGAGTTDAMGAASGTATGQSSTDVHFLERATAELDALLPRLKAIEGVFERARRWYGRLCASLGEDAAPDGSRALFTTIDNFAAELKAAGARLDAAAAQAAAQAASQAALPFGTGSANRRRSIVGGSSAANLAGLATPAPGQQSPSSLSSPAVALTFSPESAGVRLPFGQRVSPSPGSVSGSGPGLGSGSASGPGSGRRTLQPSGTSAFPADSTGDGDGGRDAGAAPPSIPRPRSPIAPPPGPGPGSGTGAFPASPAGLPPLGPRPSMMMIAPPSGPPPPGHPQGLLSGLNSSGAADGGATAPPMSIPRPRSPAGPGAPTSALPRLSSFGGPSDKPHLLVDGDSAASATPLAPTPAAAASLAAAAAAARSGLHAAASPSPRAAAASLSAGAATPRLSSATGLRASGALAADSRASSNGSAYARSVDLSLEQDDIVGILGTPRHGAGASPFASGAGLGAFAAASASSSLSTASTGSPSLGLGSPGGLRTQTVHVSGAGLGRIHASSHLDSLSAGAAAATAVTGIAGASPIRGRLGADERYRDSPSGSPTRLRSASEANVRPLGHGPPLSIASAAVRYDSSSGSGSAGGSDRRGSLYGGGSGSPSGVSGASGTGSTSAARGSIGALGMDGRSPSQLRSLLVATAAAQDLGRSL